MRSLPLLAFALLVSSSGALRAQGSELNLRQLNHRVFTALDGAPTDISAMTQTPDGILWVGGRAGLTRFDGARFVSYPAAADQPLPGTNIASLFATPEGAIWIGFRPGGAARLKDGVVVRYGEVEGLPDGTVEQFVQDYSGTLWAATRRGLVRFNGRGWERDGANIDTPYWLLVDRTGTLWVGAINGLFARALGEPQFREIDRTLTFGTGGLGLVEAPDGSIWASPHHKLVRVDPTAQTEAGRVITLRGVTSGPLLFDESGNLWASESASKSLLRVKFDALAQVTHQGNLHPETMVSTSTPEAARIFALLQDREKNVWVGTDMGLHRFSRSNVIRSSIPRCFQYGFTAAGFAAGDDGALWLACGATSGAQVVEIREGKAVRAWPSPAYSVVYRDTEGTVWFAGSTDFARLEADKLVSTPVPAQIQGRPIAALVRERTGAMWVSVTRRSLYRLDRDTWSENGGLDGLPNDWPIVATMDDNGVLWFGYSRNRLARVEGREVRVFDSSQGLEVGNVLSVLAREGEVWVGGELGLARLDGARFATLRTEGDVPFQGISGIVRARNGDIWLNGIGGIMRVDADEIEAWARVPGRPLKCEIFNHLDGVYGMAVQLRPQPSAIETTDGRIWFSTTGGFVSIDSTQLLRNTLPPPVTIWSLTSGNTRHPNLGADIRLPVHTHDLQFEYSAGSLTVPERVRFKYKLEGLDREWQEAGGRREARYTNLGPGAYTFRVIASNNDGVWNDQGASMGITIAPALYQTKWFYALCLLGCVGILAALHRLRLRQVAAQVRGRLEARLSERERIARELHDTLLQGIQGLIWRFQAATDRMPPGEPARRLMEQSLDRADKLLGESRDRVKDLRPATRDTKELTDVLVAEGEQLSEMHGARFRVSVQGAEPDLHPIAREEILMIGREAIRNAFAHARAQHVELDVIYEETALRLRVRDDGQGIKTEVLEAGGKPGHFGLMGMRERAQKLGASLDIWSKPGAGTEIDLRIPAKVVYAQSRKSTLAGAA